MIKQEILSLVKNEVGVIDPTAQHHPQFLEGAIESTLSEMYSDLYKINPNLLDNFTKQYGVSSAIAVSYESSSGLYYSTIPVKIMNLPCKSSGVRHIYSGVRSGNQFVPMDVREADLLGNTDASVVTSKIGYRVRQDTRVDFFNTNAVVRNAGVMMDLLIPFSVYDDDDVVMIPELGDKEGGSFLVRVLNKLSVVPQPDLADDNSNPKGDNNTNNRK